jgi:hypothetical protein
MSQIFQLSDFYHQRDDDATDDKVTTVAEDALVIPVSHGFVSKTSGADAEALTLADGSPGQLLVLSLTTAGGGDCTLTPATATGWATAILAVVGDTVVLLFVDDTVGWVLISATGTAVALDPLWTV